MQATHTAIDVHRTMYAHRAWFREKMLNCARGLTQEQLRRPFDMGPGGVFKLLSHCCAAEALWISLLEGASPAVPFSAPDDLPTVDALAELWNATDGRWRRLMSHLTDADLNRPIARTRDGKTLTTTLADVLVHVNMHQMYHAAQFKNMLRQLGVTDLPMSDFIVYAREQWKG
jgi:uncharacterized damage-inducible protein DinB